MKVVPLVALSLLALSSGVASANPYHERLARLPEAERNDAFTEHMSKTPEPPCKVARSFFQGFTDARAAVWSVACTNKRSYAIMVGEDARGSTKFVDCEKLKAATQGKRECFKKY